MEETYRAAARHCGSDHVIRMRRGVRNIFSVGGLVDPMTGQPSGAGEAARIDCVREFLKIRPEDVVVVYS
jgi:hypothetical protein